MPGPWIAIPFATRLAVLLPWGEKQPEVGYGLRDGKLTGCKFSQEGRKSAKPSDSSRLSPRGGAGFYCGDYFCRFSPDPDQCDDGRFCLPSRYLDDRRRLGAGRSRSGFGDRHAVLQFFLSASYRNPHHCESSELGRSFCFSHHVSDRKSAFRARQTADGGSDWPPKRDGKALRLEPSYPADRLLAAGDHSYRPSDRPDISVL